MEGGRAEGEEPRVRVRIDGDRCIGSGMCELTAPGVFTQSEDGVGRVRPGREDGAGDPLLDEAVRGCPVQAITVGTD